MGRWVTHAASAEPEVSEPCRFILLHQQCPREGTAIGRTGHAPRDLSPTGMQMSPSTTGNQHTASSKESASSDETCLCTEILTFYPNSFASQARGHGRNAAAYRRTLNLLFLTIANNSTLINKL